MPQALYEEVHCKTALTRVQGMAFGWSLNPIGGAPMAATTVSPAARTSTTIWTRTKSFLP